MRERVSSDDPRLHIYLEQWRDKQLNDYLRERETLQSEEKWKECESIDEDS